jgi:hypothetical protein
LFKKFHLRIKTFSGHENRSLTKSQKSLQAVSYPKEPELENSKYAGHQVGLKDSGSQNFRSLGFMVKAVGGAQISVNGDGGGT